MKTIILKIALLLLVATAGKSSFSTDLRNGLEHTKLTWISNFYTAIR